MGAEAAECELQIESHLVYAIKPKPSVKMHNERKGIYLAQDSFCREIIGPVHSTVSIRF